jgi:uncharacterized membrane protein
MQRVEWYAELFALAGLGALFGYELAKGRWYFGVVALSAAVVGSLSLMRRVDRNR